MRLRKQEGHWIAYFSQHWELITLTEAGDVWVPFAVSQQHRPIGEIHASSHAIRFFSDNAPSTTTLAVSLLPTPSTDLPEHP
jgi:hypothetical protein